MGREVKDGVCALCSYCSAALYCVDVEAALMLIDDEHGSRASGLLILFVLQLLNQTRAARCKPFQVVLV